MTNAEIKTPSQMIVTRESLDQTLQRLESRAGQTPEAPKASRFDPARRSAAVRKRLFQLDETSPAITTLAKTCEGFFRRCYNNDKSHGHWLVLSGGVGTGKTHCLERMDKMIGNHAVDIMFAYGWKDAFPEKVKIDWSEFAEIHPRQFDEIMNEMLGVEIVLIDEVGGETDQFKSGAPAARLRRVLELCKNKWLMLTTNVPRSKFGDVYDVRCADRLEAAVWVNLENEPSYRGRHERP